MASVNKVTILGNLGRDPEVRYLPSGEAVATISVATTEKWKDKQTGEPREATEWHRISMFGRLAEIAGEYLRKGSQAYFEGSLRTREYTDKDGVKKYSTEIRCDELKMLGSPQGGGQQGGAPRSQGYAQAPQQRAPQQPAQQRQAPAQGGGSGFEDFEDSEIPF